MRLNAAFPVSAQSQHGTVRSQNQPDLYATARQDASSRGCTAPSAEQDSLQLAPVQQTQETPSPQRETRRAMGIARKAQFKRNHRNLLRITELTRGEAKALTLLRGGNTSLQPQRPPWCHREGTTVTLQVPLTWCDPPQQVWDNTPGSGDRTPTPNTACQLCPTPQVFPSPLLTASARS